MSLQTTQNFLLSLEHKNPKEILKKLFLSSLHFEVLNPQELEGDWSSISFLENKPNSDLKTAEDVESLSFILTKNQKKGLFNAFIDTRIEGSKVDLIKAEKNKDYILGIARTFQRQDEIRKQKQEVDTFVAENSDKKILFGKDLTDFQVEFEKYINQVFLGVEKLKNEGKLEAIRKPKVDLVKLSNLDAIYFEQDDLEAVKSFITDQTFTTNKLQTAKQIKAELDEEFNKNLASLQEFKVSPNPTELDFETLKQISALHANMELDLKVQSCLKNTFSLSKDASAKFLFITVVKNEEEKTAKVLEELEIPYQKTEWNQEIYDWQNQTGFRAFQSVAQSIGTIDKQESDPTNVLGIFFMIFFAFCLNDALYGLLLSAFTGYFLFFTKIKEQFRNMFSLFFYSGLATFLFGILTNSWAGDFFNSDLYKNITGSTAENTTAHNFLAQFQIIDVLNSEANAPINNALNGVSPIIFMLMVAVAIGFLALLSSYLLRISTSLKRAEYAVAFGQLAWIFFLSAAVSYFILSANNYDLAGQILLGAGVASLLIFNQAKSIGGKILGFLFGPRGLYGIIQMGADLMSFTRIVAIGLTGGVIASIVNLLAGILYESTNPVVGIILAIIMLLVGHTFNLVLSLFGAYINPVRLTYVEFMPKFFLGEGRQVNKFSPDLQYFRIID